MTIMLLRAFKAWQRWRDNRACLCGCIRLAHRHNRAGSSVRTAVSYCGRHAACVWFRPQGLPWWQVVTGSPAPRTAVTPDRIAETLAVTAADQAEWLAGLRVKYGLRCHGQANPVDLGMPRWPHPPEWVFTGCGPVDGFRWETAPDPSFEDLQRQVAARMRADYIDLWAMIR